MSGFETQREAGIVHEKIDILEIVGNVGDRRLDRSSIPNIEDKRVNPISAQFLRERIEPHRDVFGGFVDTLVRCQSVWVSTG